MILDLVVTDHLPIPLHLAAAEELGVVWALAMVANILKQMVVKAHGTDQQAAEPGGFLMALTQGYIAALVAICLLFLISVGKEHARE
jgi:hypothetical protein